jgi:hypothetical protein
VWQVLHAGAPNTYKFRNHNPKKAHTYEAAFSAFAFVSPTSSLREIGDLVRVDYVFSSEILKTLSQVHFPFLSTTLYSDPKIESHVSKDDWIFVMSV